jgi:hypothetical protein
MDTDTSYWTLKEDNTLSGESLMGEGPDIWGVIVE